MASITETFKQAIELLKSNEAQQAVARGDFHAQGELIAQAMKMLRTVQHQTEAAASAYKDDEFETAASKWWRHYNWLDNGVHALSVGGAYPDCSIEDALPRLERALNNPPVKTTHNPFFVKNS